MAIKEEYVSEFLPIHQLDNLGPNTQYTPEGLVLADINQNDLFLVSKLCAYATQKEDSVMVSKSLKYGNLRDKLSNDCSIQEIKNDILEVSSNLCDFSCDIYQNIVPFLSTYTEICSTILSNDYTDKIKSVSNDLEYRKTDKQRNDIISSLSDGYFIKSFEFDNEGHIKQLSLNNIDRVSKYLTIDGEKVSGGTIAGDCLTTEKYVLKTANTKKIIHNVSEDSYVTIGISVIEDDSCDKPLEVWLHNKLSGQTVESKLCHFNNPGGFSGQRYYNYYFDGFPIKQISSINSKGIEENSTWLEIKYSNNQPFIYDSENKSVFEFREHPLYATISKSDLSGVVQAVDGTSEAPVGLYKISVSKQGLVLDHVKVDISSIAQEIPSPTQTQPGTIKTGKENNQKENPQTLGVRVDDQRNAYVNISSAEPDVYGTVKVHSSNDHNTDESENYLRIPVKIDAKGQLYAEIQEGRPTNHENYSILRTSGTQLDGEKRYLHAQDGGYGYVTVPQASNNEYGTVKLGNSYVVGQVYKDTKDGVIKVNIGDNNYLPTTGGTMTGVLKLSRDAIFTPDDTSNQYIRIHSGTSLETGASLLLTNMNYNQPYRANGEFQMVATDGILHSSLIGQPDGTLTWNGQSLLTSKEIFPSPQKNSGDYDESIRLYLRDNGADVSKNYIYYRGDTKNSCSDFGRYIWFPRREDIKTINRPFIATAIYYGACPDDPTYGVQLICDGTPCCCWHPKYMKTVALTMTSGYFSDTKCLGKFKGYGRIIAAVSDNKGFEQSTTSAEAVDAIELLIKYI